MPVLIEEPTDSGSTFDSERSVATPTPLDDRSGTETGVAADADAVPVRRNPRRLRRKRRRFC